MLIQPRNWWKKRLQCSRVTSEKEVHFQKAMLCLARVHFFLQTFYYYFCSLYDWRGRRVLILWAVLGFTSLQQWSLYSARSHCKSSILLDLGAFLGSWRYLHLWVWPSLNRAQLSWGWSGPNHPTCIGVYKKGAPKSAAAMRANSLVSGVWSIYSVPAYAQI